MTVKSPIARRIIACACSIAMAGTLLPAAAFAGTDDETKEAAALTILSVQLDDEGAPIATTKTTAATFTASQLSSAAQSGSYSYIYGGKSSKTKVDASQVVTFNSLLSGVIGWDGNASFKLSDSAADTVKVDDLFTSKPYKYSYSDVSSDKSYFPKYENSTESKINTDGAVKVPAGLALSAKKGTIEENATAAETQATEEVTSTPIGVIGSANDGSSLATGNQFWTGVKTIVVYYTSVLTIKTATKQADGSIGASTTAKTFTASQLAELAKANAGKVANYLYSGKGKITKLETDDYVTYSQLFSGINAWKSGAVVTVADTGGATGNTGFTYSELSSPGYYFPKYENATGAQINKDDAVEVPAGIAITTKSGIVEDSAIAEETTCDSAGKSMCTVLGASKNAESLLAGMCFWGNVGLVTIISPAKNTISASSKLTVKPGKSAQIKVSKAQGTLSYKSGSKLVTVNGKGKVTVSKKAKLGKTYTVTVTAAGNDNFTAGSVTVKVCVKGANTLKVTPAKKTVKRGTSFKIKTRKAKGKVSYKSSNKKVKVTKKGVVKIGKKAKKGSCKITVKAAGNSKYLPGSKTVKVRIK